MKFHEIVEKLIDHLEEDTNPKDLGRNASIRRLKQVLSLGVNFNDDEVNLGITRKRTYRRKKR